MRNRPRTPDCKPPSTPLASSNGSSFSEDEKPTQPPRAVHPAKPENSEFIDVLPPPNPLIPQSIKYEDDPPRIFLKASGDLNTSKSAFIRNSPKKPVTSSSHNDFTLLDQPSQRSATRVQPESKESMEELMSLLLANDSINTEKYPEVVYARNCGSVPKPLEKSEPKGRSVSKSSCSPQLTPPLPNVSASGGTGANNSNNKDSPAAFYSIPQNLLLSKESPPAAFYTKSSATDKTLVFESRFESGNLNYVVKVSDTMYVLVLQADSNCMGHTQWYYFRVGNTTAGDNVRFNIVNMSKADSLYKRGMKVLIRSASETAANGTQWFRGGEEIDYYDNGYEIFDGVEYKRLNTLSFTYKFPHFDDTVDFAYSQPYTYTHLQHDLSRLNPRNPWIKRGILCNSLGNVPCEYLVISAGARPDKKKLAAILTARVHPGETVSSFMMKGAIEFLTSKEPEAVYLRENFLFLVVPMLNPDGVIIGNNRYGLDGSDLNRKFRSPNKTQQQTIYYMKKIIRSVSRDCTLVLYCDMHGHSKNRDVFIYGNTDMACPNQYKIFPMILSCICPAFSFPASCFQVERNKLATARVTVWKEFELYNVFTLESSFFGSNKDSSLHYGIEDYTDVGRKVCLAAYVCHRLGLSSFLQSGRVGAALFDKSISYSETEAACGFRLKDLRDLIKSRLPFQDICYPPLQPFVEDSDEPTEGFSLLVTAEPKKPGEGKKDATATTSGTTNNSGMAVTSVKKQRKRKKGAVDRTRSGYRNNVTQASWNTQFAVIRSILKTKKNNKGKEDVSEVKTATAEENRPKHSLRTSPAKGPKLRNFSEGPCGHFAQVKSNMPTTSVYNSNSASKGAHGKFQGAQKQMKMKCVPIHAQNFPLMAEPPPPQSQQTAVIPAFRPPGPRRNAVGRRAANRAFFEYFRMFMLDHELKKYENSVILCRNRCVKEQIGKHTKSVSENRVKETMSLRKGSRYTPKDPPSVPRVCRSSMAGKVAPNENKAGFARCFNVSLY